MRKPGIIAILVLSAISIAGAQNLGSANSGSASKHAITRRVIHIVSPAFGENLEGTSVSIRYEVSSTKRTSTRPTTFRIQMDSQPPVETTETAYTFDSLAPGPHDVTVELLDSRNRPALLIARQDQLCVCGARHEFHRRTRRRTDAATESAKSRYVPPSGGRTHRSG